LEPGRAAADKPSEERSGCCDGRGISAQLNYVKSLKSEESGMKAGKGKRKVPASLHQILGPDDGATHYS
jgi:hypothetical protein